MVNLPPLLDTCPSTESSLGNEAPLTRHSRKKQSKSASNGLTAVRLQRLEKSWKKRYQNRLIQHNQSPSSSDDDDDQHNLHKISVSLLEKGLASYFKSNQQSRRQLLTKPDLQKALKQLPRPSMVVPDIADGIHHDQLRNDRQKATHKRRIAATVIGIEYLNRAGTQDPVPQWRLDKHNLKKYTRHMQPPKEDLTVDNYTLDHAMLSKTYRGTFLRSRQLGETSHPPTLQKQNEPIQTSLPLNDYDPGSFADIEYIYSTDTSSAAASVEDVEQSNSSDDQNSVPDQNTPNKPAWMNMTNQDFVDEAIHDKSSSSSDSDKDSVDSGDPSAVTTPAVEQQSQAKDSKGPFLDFMINLLAANPTALQETPKEQKPLQAEEEKEKKQGSPDAKSTLEKPVLQVDDKKVSNDSDEVLETPVIPTLLRKNMSKFEREKEKALLFARNWRSSRKRRRPNGTGVNARERTVRKKNSDDIIEVINLDNEKEVNYGKAKHMMDRMGFKRRLGAREDGLLNPLEGTKNEGRSGLGAKPSFILRDNIVKSDVITGRGVFKNVKGVASEAGTTDGPARSSDVVTRNVVSKRSDSVRDSINLQLDMNDVYETETEDALDDNGRRALLIDINVLVKNAQKRQTDAFAKMAVKHPKFRHHLPLQDLFAKERKVLSDVECLQVLAKESQLPRTKEALRSLQEELDGFYKEGDEVELDMEVIKLLRSHCKNVHFGLFYGGSQQRFKWEIGSWNERHCKPNESQFLPVLKLPECILSAPLSTVKIGDHWPYTEAWRDLVLKVGTTASQCAIFEQAVAGNQAVSTGVAAGVFLGAHTMTVLTGNGEVQLSTSGFRSEGVIELMKSENLSCIPTQVEKVIQLFFRERAKRRKRRRVLALNEEENLWYCGREELGKEHTLGGNGDHCMIWFYELDKMEWVDSDNIFSLSRENFRKLRDQGFPGSIDPEDVGINFESDEE